MRLDPLSEIVIKVAYEQGLLQQPSLNPFQYWALRYYWADREEHKAEVRAAMLKEAAYIFNYDRYLELWGKPVQEALEELEGLPINPAEIDTIESFLQTVDKKRVGSVPSDDSDEGWY